MSEPQLFIDPECRLFKVPYKVANNMHYVRYEDYAGLQMERIHDLNQMGGLCEENARLKAEVERLKEGNECLDQMHEKEMARSAFLCEQVERLTKAVMHSPAAQLKLKELEGKTTFEEINSDNQ